MKNSIEALRIRGVTVECYLPRTGERSPVVLILPILEDETYLVERNLARYFAKHGFAALIIERQKGDLTNGIQVNQMLKQALNEAKLVIDWIERDSDFDKDCIAVLGISLGGIYGTILATVDWRIKAAALVLVGGDLPSIIAHSRERGIAMRRKNYLEERQMTLAEFERELQNSIVFDPLAFAPNTDREKILLVLARFDTVMPYANGLILRTAMKHPETITLWSGHYTAILYLPYIRRAILKFLRRKLVRV